MRQRFGGRIGLDLAPNEKMLANRWKGGIIMAYVVLGLLCSVAYTAYSQECELNCKTRNCSPQGECICDIPTEQSMLSGNRNFTGGVFCDTPAVMCDGTNTFWCESGGVCNEIVQGENYTCSCPRGHAGEHCDLVGEICAGTYCYNGGICSGDDLSGNGLCDCLVEFRGADDCSIATVTATPPLSGTQDSDRSKHHSSKWVTPFLAVVAALIAGAVAFILVVRFRNQNKTRQAARFSQLEQLQMNQEFVDDEHDDPFRDGRGANR